MHPTQTLSQSLTVALFFGIGAASLVSRASQASTPQKSCNVRGFDRGHGNYMYDNSGKFATYAACSGLCLKSAKCQSLSFNTAADECLLFKIPVSGNIDLAARAPDASVFYDRGCLSGDAPIATGTGVSVGAAPTVTQAANATVVGGSSGTTNATPTSKASSVSTTSADSLSTATSNSSLKAANGVESPSNYTSPFPLLNGTASSSLENATSGASTTNSTKLVGISVRHGHLIAGRGN